MSYILEALKKAERERQQGRSPGPTTVQEPGAAPHHPRWLWLLSAAFLANAVLLGLFWRRQIPDQASVAPTPVVQAVAPAAHAVRPTQAPPAAPPASAAACVPVDEKRPAGIGPRAPATPDRPEPPSASTPFSMPSAARSGWCPSMAGAAAGETPYPRGRASRRSGAAGSSSAIRASASWCIPERCRPRSVSGRSGPDDPLAQLLSPDDSGKCR
jgi:general secretion pathway protein B